MDGSEEVEPGSQVNGGVRLSFGRTPPPASVGGGGTGGLARKRGRPRKCKADGCTIGEAALGPALSGAASSSNPPVKRRGRPPGSNKKRQLDALGCAGIGFTPHIITLQAGEDIASRIMALSQLGPRTICILSANGAISNVTLRQPAISGGTATYEGHFDILSLSGSFLPTDDGATRSRTGGLSVALVGPDGRVLGGAVAGMLMAATSVQVFLASFIMEGKRPKSEPVREEPPSGSSMVGSTVASAASPPSQGTSSESSEYPGSPLDLDDGVCNNSSPCFPSSYASVGWPSSNP